MWLLVANAPSTTKFDGMCDAFIAPDLQVLRIDDAGWGFPLCGVVVGVCDEQNVKTAVVPVSVSNQARMERDKNRS